ncbi:hypothetical protein [Stenotrophomonas sp. Iso1]|uniref:hypothetical protein n=1 Tax=Stenotrophomonas sp. Iso1 TaxID=2977283 RepID=UPI0022B7C77C|nr:hypothetical protein [Stenotrophomonas sp. Iso1]
MFRFIGRLLFEVFVEFLFHETGRVITRLLSPGRHFEGITLTVVGLLFWSTAALLLFFGYRTLA